MIFSSLLLAACSSVALGDLFVDSTDLATNDTCVYSLYDPANATDTQNATTSWYSTQLGVWRVAVSTTSHEVSLKNNTESTESSPDAITNIWLDPFTTVDLTDGSNPFSACGYIFKELPYNTMLRGQQDDGSCEQMLSSDCINAITSRAAETARWLVQDPTPGRYNNLTPPILDYVCEQILQGIGEGPAPKLNLFPSECTPFFEAPSYPTVDYLPLTSNETASPNCTLPFDYMDETGGNGFVFPSGMHYQGNAYNGSVVSHYDELVDQVWPVLTVIFPPANASRQSGISDSMGAMTCLRAGKNIKPNSRLPPALPAAKPVHFPTYLSKGAIAGIVVGSVLVLAILVGSIWYFRNKRRNALISSSEDDAYVKELSPASKKRTSVYQLDGKGAAVQLDSKQRAELTGDYGGHELVSPPAPQELPGSAPLSSVSKLDDSNRPPTS